MLARDALALAPALLRLAEHHPLGLDGGPRDQQARGSAGDRLRPEVEHILIQGLGLEIGDKAAIGRQIDPSGRGTVQSGRVEHPPDR